MNKTFTIIVMLLISGMTGTVFAGFTTQQLTNDALVDTVPTIAVGSDGVAHIAWYHNAEIFYSTFSNGVFGAPTNVSNMSGDDLRPCIAVDNNGHVHIAWHHYRGNIYYANNSSGSFVTQAVAYSYYGCKPSLALDSTNTPHITWGDYGTNGIHYASGDFSNEITLPGTTGDDEEPAIGVDSGDYVHIIWENNAFYYTNNVSGTFADPTSIGGGGDAPPNMEFDSGDHIHIAFTKSYSMVDPPWSQRDVIYGNNVSGSFSFR